MQWTGLNELREKYLHYFEGKGHLRLGSFPLVPKDDPSLLLINSGMAPMKKWFLGQEEPPRHRVTTCQKCIRTPDIERVGITARHGCFFEMLGNFSFQDYFKKEVIPWAWEFLTKELEIPADRLYISVYQDDDEAYDIWTKSVGIPEDHMVRLGKEDNFWEHGSGPCGPCSEIYFDRGLKYGCGKPGFESAREPAQHGVGLHIEGRRRIGGIRARSGAFVREAQQRQKQPIRAVGGFVFPEEAGIKIERAHGHVPPAFRI